MIRSSRKADWGQNALNDSENLDFGTVLDFLGRETGIHRISNSWLFGEREREWLLNDFGKVESFLMPRCKGIQKATNV